MHLVAGTVMEILMVIETLKLCFSCSLAANLKASQPPPLTKQMMQEIGLQLPAASVHNSKNATMEEPSVEEVHELHHLQRVAPLTAGRRALSCKRLFSIVQMVHA